MTVNAHSNMNRQQSEQLHKKIWQERWKHQSKITFVCQRISISLLPRDNPRANCTYSPRLCYGNLTHDQILQVHLMENQKSITDYCYKNHIETWMCDLYWRPKIISNRMLINGRKAIMQSSKDKHGNKEGKKKEKRITVMNLWYSSNQLVI